MSVDSSWKKGDNEGEDQGPVGRSSGPVGRGFSSTSGVLKKKKIINNSSSRRRQNQDAKLLIPSSLNLMHRAMTAAKLKTPVSVIYEKSTTGSLKFTIQNVNISNLRVDY